MEDGFRAQQGTMRESTIFLKSRTATLSVVYVGMSVHLSLLKENPLFENKFIPSAGTEPSNQYLIKVPKVLKK